MLVTRDPFRQLDRQLGWFSTAATQLPVDIIRREHELELRVDAPGITSDHLDVTVERRVLTITADRPTTDDETYITRERRGGVASRSFTLSEGLDAAALDASLDAGVLTIRIPVADAAKPQKVHVAIGTGPAAIEATAN